MCAASEAIAAQILDAKAGELITCQVCRAVDWTLPADDELVLVVDLRSLFGRALSCRRWDS